MGLVITKLIFILFVTITLCSCALILLNGRLSHGYYISSDDSFKCKLPGGVLSTQLEISDSNNSLGETVTFKHRLGLLWRVDHLKVSHHRLAIIDNSKNRRENLEQAKVNYIKYYLANNVDIIDINWELFDRVNDNDVLLVNAYLKWGEKEEGRELLFSINNNYLNVIHHSQNISSKLQKITSGAVDLYKSCEFY